MRKTPLSRTFLSIIFSIFAPNYTVLTTMFEEFALTYQKNVEHKDELPNMMRIGGFDRKTANVPFMLPFDMLNGLCFEINRQTQEAVNRQMQYIALNLIKQVSPKMLRLTFVDIGLNTNFPLLHALKVPSIKFVTNRKELEKEMDSLFETARFISSKCVGSEYATLKDYNAVSNYKEPYNVLFIANFPKEFRTEDINTVSMLVNEGMKCGIQVVMSCDKAFYPNITAYNQDEFTNLLNLEKQMIWLDCTQEKTVLKNLNIPTFQNMFARYPFVFENYPQNELSELIGNINTASVKQDNQFTDFISIPIGRSGREEVYFEMGEKADVYHCLMAGASRTGKSTLLNNIITSIADRYSPDEMRLYLLDYKEGVEFQMYETHPNVELLLLDNSNFGVGVEALKQFRDEINKRSKLFKELSLTISNINEYNKMAEQKIPRMLLIIDEVQQLFLDYQSSRLVNPYVKDIARQGGAFGIHLFFCSQSYVDSKIDDAAMSQMGLRISYRLANSRECRAILKGDNDAPTKLARFQMVYNSHFGDKEYNRFVNADNFEKKHIISLLAQAAEKHKIHRPFEKRIITRTEEEQNTPKEEEKPKKKPLELSKTAENKEKREKEDALWAKLRNLSNNNNTTQ